MGRRLNPELVRKVRENTTSRGLSEYVAELANGPQGDASQRALRALDEANRQVTG